MDAKYQQQMDETPPWSMHLMAQPLHFFMHKRRLWSANTGRYFLSAVSIPVKSVHPASPDGYWEDFRASSQYPSKAATVTFASEDDRLKR
jgi:hypothetical protein